MKMSEHVVEAEMSRGRGRSSISRMTSLGEGIYASSTSADVQQTDQIGLTLSPKITSGVKLSFDTCVITDEDFEDALKQLEPLLVEAEGKTSSLRVDTIHGSRRCYIAPVAKGRTISRSLAEPLLQKPSLSPTSWPISPPLNTALPVSVSVCSETSHQDDRKHSLCIGRSGLPPSATNSSQESIESCRENVGNTHPFTHGKVESIQETNTEIEASNVRRLVPTKSREINFAGSDSAVPERDLKDNTGRVKNGQSFNIADGGAGNGESACVASLCHGKVFWDPDVPLHSVEEEFQWAAADCLMDMCSSRSCDAGGTAVPGVRMGSKPIASQTIAGGTQLAANETTQKSDASQDSLQKPRKSLQTSTLASIARLFLQNIQQALVEGYYKSLSTIQIPAELRAHFNALLRTFQSDEQFQKAIEAFAMELTGATPPNESEPVLIPKRLRQALQEVYKKYGAEEGFRKCLDKFIIEFLEEQKFYEEFLAGVMEPDDGKLGGKRKIKDLDGLTVEQLKVYCRDLYTSRAEYQELLSSTKDRMMVLMKKQAGESRVRQHPAERMPVNGKWTCFNPTVTGKDNKPGPCRRTNSYYESKLVWKEITHCKACKGPYNESFELMKKRSPRKQKANNAATPVARQSPQDAQFNDHYTSSIAQAAPLFDASSGQMYGYLGGHEEIGAQHLSPGWLPILDGRHCNASSERIHSSPMGEPFSGVNGSIACDHPGSRDADIRCGDSSHLNMDFNAQDEEFDEFVMDSEPLVMDENMTLDPSAAYASHYPDQLNLFPQQIGTISEARRLPSLHQPQATVGYSNYGSGHEFASSTYQQHGLSSNWSPTHFENLHEAYQSPYSTIDSSAPIQSAKFGNTFSTGTLQAVTHPGGMIPMSSTTVALPHLQQSLSRPHTDHAMTKAGLAIIITEAENNAGASLVQTETSEPALRPSRLARVMIPKVQKSEKANKPKGPGRGWARSLVSKSRVSPKTPRPSRSKEAIAQRAALNAKVSKTTVFTESRIQRIRTQNNTSAVFLRKTMKSWEEPVVSYPPKFIIEIPDDDVEVQLEAQEERQQELQQEEDELTAALNAEFDLQDRAADLEAAGEESDISEEE